MDWVLVFGIIKKAVLIFWYQSLCVNTFSQKIPSSGIAGSGSKCMFNFISNHQNLFQSDYHFAFLFAHPHILLSVFGTEDFKPLSMWWCLRILVGISLITLIILSHANWPFVFFLCFILFVPFLCSILYLNHLSSLKWGYLSYYWIVRILYSVYKSFIIFILKIFSSSLVCIFSFVFFLNWVFWIENLNFDVSH